MPHATYICVLTLSGGAVIVAISANRGPSQLQACQQLCLHVQTALQPLIANLCILLTAGCTWRCEKRPESARPKLSASLLLPVSVPEEPKRILRSSSSSQSLYGTLIPRSVMGHWAMIKSGLTKQILANYSIWGMKVGGSKTEYMCVNETERQWHIAVARSRLRWSRWTSSSIWGSTVQSNGAGGVSVERVCRQGGAGRPVEKSGRNDQWQ